MQKCFSTYNTRSVIFSRDLKESIRNARIRRTFYLAPVPHSVEGEIAREIRGCMYTKHLLPPPEHMQISFPRLASMLDPLPSLHCFVQLFFPLAIIPPRRSISPCAPFARPFAFAVPHRTAGTRARLYGTYGDRYVLWLIVLLSLTYFQFTAAAVRRFASWLSIVRDERRFMRAIPDTPGL